MASSLRRNHFIVQNNIEHLLNTILYMKISGKGIIVIIVFLILIPLLTDLFFATFFPDTKIFDYSITKSFIGQYIKLIPFYIGYLIVAFTVLYFLKKYWKNNNQKKDDLLNR